MKRVVVSGAQWGDEGKGKVVDLISSQFDFVVRFQGGNNAGHSVAFDGKRFALHLLPSGIFQEQTVNLIANGVVVDPIALVAEMDKLEKAGVHISKDRLAISDRAQVLLPYHIILDKYREIHRADRKLGTTGKGIGPCYEFKAGRRGIRYCDVLLPEVLEERLSSEIQFLKAHYPHVDELQALSPETVMNQIGPALDQLRPRIVDGVTMLHQARSQGKRVLFEGAQATLLDVDFGTYPFVTSSNSCSLGVSAGAGIPPHSIEKVIGIAKAYCTRVGEGPFPTELEDEIGQHLRDRGHEYGTTTGRPRRCGWLDLVALKYVHMLNDFSTIALMKCDVLDELDTIQLCVGYEIDGQSIEHFPASAELLSRIKPIYKAFEGWKTSLNQCQNFDELPAQAKLYFEFIEGFVGCSIDLVSTGPDRTETLIRKGSDLDLLWS